MSITMILVSFFQFLIYFVSLIMLVISDIMVFNCIAQFDMGSC